MIFPANETGEWIFSEEYHNWQDLHRQGIFRPGGSALAFSGSFAAGLFQFRDQDQAIAAVWTAVQDDPQEA